MPGTEQRRGDEQDDATSPPSENPTRNPVVHDWIAHRVAADEQMRWAGAARKAREHVQEES